MPTKSYYSVGGRIIGERTEGQPRVDYLTGPVGSVTATANDQGQVVNRYRYKPYGQLLAKTGSGADPRFLWVGSWGYRQTGNPDSEVYIRGRHYATTRAVFTTNAPFFARIGFGEPGYTYAMCNPINVTDPSGMLPASLVASPIPCSPEPACCCCVDGLKAEGWLGRLVGHTLSLEFRVLPSYYYKTTTTSARGDCTLEWWEMCSRPSDSPVINDWYDMYTIPKLKNSGTLGAWTHREKPCPGRPKKRVVMPEGPSFPRDLSLPRGYGETKNLCIFIFIKSSPGCDCPTKELSLSIFVKLRFYDGKPDDVYFESPAKDPYCFSKEIPRRS